MNNVPRAMRDVLIEGVYERMKTNKKIFFVCADFGSPKLDKLKMDFKDRFLNVGIAEQNLINVSAGLALEGFDVFAYAIAPFLTMRAFEQIRINLSLLGQIRKMNVNLIGVGAGLSYDVSGPTHHCIEDLSIIRTLPNIKLYSPCDHQTVFDLIDVCINDKSPKYFRLDSKPALNIHKKLNRTEIIDGYKEVNKGTGVCVISTGFMTRSAFQAIGKPGQSKYSAGLIDIFELKSLNTAKLLRIIKRYKSVITIEEGFIHKGGLDSLILDLLNRNNIRIPVKSMGFEDIYSFEVGSRQYLHKLNNIDTTSIGAAIAKCLQ